MESQIQIQSDVMEVVIPSGSGAGTSGVVERSRRQQNSPVSVSSTNSGRASQKGQKQGAMPRVLIVSSAPIQQTTGPTMTTRSAINDRKSIAQQDPQASTHIQHHGMPSRQIVIHQPSTTPTEQSTSNNQSAVHVVGNGQQATAMVQNGQLVITNLNSENRSRSQQQQQSQMHRQQQIVIIQQPDPNIEDDKGDDPQSQDQQPLHLGVAQTITVSVSDPEGRGGDGSAAAIYPTLQAATYSVYPGDSGGYSPQGHHYYTGQVSYQTPLHSPASTYIIQSGGGLQHSPLGGGPCNQVVGVHEDDAAAQQLSHTTRASPATITWLLQNYETAEGVSLPRCTLYNHYLKHCSEHKLDPVNAASFGKLIRSVFLGLRTRRLGTRGNSKYHYYGIRIKPESPLNRISDESMATMAMRQQPTGQSRRPRPMLSTPPAPTVQAQSNLASGTSAGSLHGQQSTASMLHHQSAASADTGSASGTPNSIHSTSAATTALPMSAASQHAMPADGNKQYLGDGLIPDVMPPPLEHLEPSLGGLGLSVADAARFFSAYRNHCEDILDCVKNLMFTDVERCWRQFWQPDEIRGGRDQSSLDEDIDSDLDEDDSMSTHNLSGLNRMQLYSLCTLPVVQEFVQTMDFQFYQILIDVLIPNVLKPIPSTLTQSIRNFAKRLESGLGLALQGAPDVIVRIKLDAVGSLAQTLRRYTSLNHLAQAARAVLQNGAQIQQMLTDLNRVDFHNVQEQASWVCDCDPALVDQIEKDFKTALERQKTLEQWGSWLETVVDQVLGGYDVLSIVNGRPEHDASVVRLTTVARQFLLKWSFYSSMVMRDLTLRSAPSFGSFHLIRLLYDEYMFYLVEQRVARLTGQTTIAVMSQSYRSHIASLASGEQEYHAYQLHEQQDLSHGQQESEAVQQRHHLAQESHLENPDAYPNAAIDSGRRHFQETISNSQVQDQGDVAVAMDRDSQSHGTSTVITIPIGIQTTDMAYVLHHNPNAMHPNDQHQDDAEESNVVDEYFITTTIHEEQQSKPSRMGESSTTDEAASILSNMASSHQSVDWEQQASVKRDDHISKSTDIHESCTPMKKRKMSLKYNGDASMD